MVLVFGLVLLAGKLGLDVLIGGFVAGMIVRLALKGHELRVFESKLTAVGFGFFVPFFFVTSGIEFDLAALGSVKAIAKLAMFFVHVLVVRGTPAMLLYRGVIGRPRPRRPRLLLGDPAAPGRSHHHDRNRVRPHEDLDRGRPGRRRDALDPRLPLRRPGPAQALGGRAERRAHRARRVPRPSLIQPPAGPPMIDPLPGA